MKKNFNFLDLMCILIDVDKTGGSAGVPPPNDGPKRTIAPGSWFCALFLDLDLSGVSAKLRSCGSEFRRNERSDAATEHPDHRYT